METITSSNATGVSVAYTYDGLNRLSTVVDNRLQGSNTTAYTYDNASNVATVKYPNGLTSTFTYDPLNRLAGLRGRGLLPRRRLRTLSVRLFEVSLQRFINLAQQFLRALAPAQGFHQFAAELLLGVVQFRQRKRQVNQSALARGSELERGTIAINRAAAVADAVQCEAEVIVELGMDGVVRDRAPQMLDALGRIGARQHAEAKFALCQRQPLGDVEVAVAGGQLRNRGQQPGASPVRGRRGACGPGLAHSGSM